MLYLNKNDIYDLITYDEIMDAIEEAFKIHGSKNYDMPNRIHVSYRNNTLLYMPCFLQDIFGTKLLTLFPENRKKNRPVIDGLMLLNDYETGEPIGMMDGKILTALRTGAVGGVGIRHFTPETAKTVGLVGAGVQGFYQLLFACKARKIDKIMVFDIFTEKLAAFVKELEVLLPNVSIVIANTIEDLLKESQIVITTTTSYKPVLPEKPELLKGKSFIGIGSYKPNMREYPDILFSLLDKVYIDTEFAKEESGDLKIPLSNNLLQEDKIETVGSFLTNKKEIINKTIFYKSVGMALFDVVVAKLIYDEAKKNNVGQKIIL
ncbi:ornithine cyclodeaminase family protein [Paramaledivibacter caminithermalis]|uniref:Ornithine cyclodeaminase n=1 Tax=Paramaledivibacter caminithermalis (strain DSM 15212 / CIP 107654 / DViRD3) TaxID=1121301 RepID=A0A1M6PRF9_PARC5|nr:ornithine cyclodeaminase family protein [Paramaledivibacter caminithermalis]SHK10471.1 ornithine cyclodeaminase [Paramaledivibacter caminithermalis DSM 15212]